MNKKGAIEIDETVAFILAVIVIVIVVILLVGFGDKLIGFIKILPSYELPDEDLEVIINQSDVEAGEGNADSGCSDENAVGRIKDNVIYLRDGFQSRTASPTNFYFDGNKVDGEIKLKQTLWGFDRGWIDKKVANVRNGVIEVIGGNYGGALDAQLKVLDNTKIKLNNLLCRNE